MSSSFDIYLQRHFVAKMLLLSVLAIQKYPHKCFYSKSIPQRVLYGLISNVRRGRKSGRKREREGERERGRSKTLSGVLEHPRRLTINRIIVCWLLVTCPFHLRASSCAALAASLKAAGGIVGGHDPFQPAKTGCSELCTKTKKHG